MDNVDDLVYLLESYNIALKTVDKTGVQENGEFEGRMRDPEIHRIACEVLEKVRWEIINKYNYR